jgi:hypothetical protein
MIEIQFKCLYVLTKIFRRNGGGLSRTLTFINGLTLKPFLT